MYGIIYKVTNTINNKVYIGQTIKTLNERKYYHYYRAKNEPEITRTHFINAIRKYGENVFIWEQIDSANSKEELNEKEQYWINYYNSINYGYNIQKGGSLKGNESDKFAQMCGSKPFLAFKVNGEFLGEFINKAEFSRHFNIASTHITDMVKNRMISCNGIIAIDKENFSEELLKERIQKSKQTFRPFIAINLNTFEKIGPFNSMKECKEKLKLKNNHIGEILKGKRKSQEGYTFKFIDE